MVTSPLSNSENFRHIERTYDNMMPEDDFDESESDFEIEEDGLAKNG
jgi:hypothetical protein